MEVPELPDCELSGNAAACAAALGDWGGVGGAAARLVRVEARFEPDPRLRRDYDRLYGIFADAVAAFIPFSERLVSKSRDSASDG